MGRIWGGKKRLSFLSLRLCVVRSAWRGSVVGTDLLTSRQPSLLHYRVDCRRSRERLGLRPGGISSVLAGSDSPGIRPDWFSGADNSPCGTRQATSYSFNFGHNSDLWAVCIISLCCQNSMNLFPKVSRLYFSNSFQAYLYCLLHLLSCKNEWPIC